MKQYPTLRRLLAAAASVVVFAAVVTAVACFQRAPDPGKVADDTRAEVRADTRADARADAKPSGNWVMFGGTNSRNFVNTFEKNVPTDWSVEEGKEKNIKWSAEPGSKAYGGPVIADGKVFVGTNNERPRDPKITGDKGVLMCFNEADGKFLWQTVYDKLPAGRVNDWPGEGICSSPVVEGKKLWYVNNRAEVVCADTETGKAHWKFDLIKELGVFVHNLAVCSPLILKDNLYLVTANGVDETHINIPAPKAPSFICLDKATGKKVQWSSNLPSVKAAAGQPIKELVDQGLVLMHGQWSNPVIAEVEGKPQAIFPGGDGWLYSFEPESGKLIWKFDCNPKKAFYELGGKGTRNDFLATPVVWENKVYVGVGQDPEHKEGVGHLWCIDAAKGKDGADVSPVNDNFDPKAAVNKNSALVWHYGGAGKGPEGSRRNYVFGRTLSTCAVHDGLLYTGELAGYVYCFDARTGEKYWEHYMESPLWSSPYWVDGKVYFGNDNGELFIFEHGKKKNILKKIDMEGAIRATPVVANGVLYVMAENKLYAIKK